MADAAGEAAVTLAFYKACWELLEQSYPEDAEEIGDIVARRIRGL